MIEKQFGKKVKYLRTDNDLEFYSEEFNAIARRMHYKESYRCPHSSIEWCSRKDESHYSWESSLHAFQLEDAQDFLGGSVFYRLLYHQSVTFGRSW